MSDVVNFTTPVGRLVGGSLYKPQDKDADGKPLLTKDSKPTVRYWLPLAIPKGQETHWSQTPWGKAIWDVGVKAFGQAASAPSFAWKIVDGDSTVPNKRGKAPCTNEGYPGHWVLNFGGTYAPKAVNKDGSAYLLEPDAIKAGYYVQIAGSVSDNKPSQSPGVYLNYALVSLQGFGPEISQGMNPAEAGFGQAPLPAGASPVPVGGMPAATVFTGAGTGWGAAAPVAPIAVTPNPSFLMPPPAAPVAAPPAAPVMTPKANGVTYEQYRAAGWTDAQLRENGMMV